MFAPRFSQPRHGPQMIVKLFDTGIDLAVVDVIGGGSRFQSHTAKNDMALVISFHVGKIDGQDFRLPERQGHPSKTHGEHQPCGQSHRD